MRPDDCRDCLLSNGRQHDAVSPHPDVRPGINATFGVETDASSSIRMAVRGPYPPGFFGVQGIPSIPAPEYGSGIASLREASGTTPNVWRRPYLDIIKVQRTAVVERDSHSRTNLAHVYPFPPLPGGTMISATRFPPRPTGLSPCIADNRWSVLRMRPRPAVRDGSAAEERRPPGSRPRHPRCLLRTGRRRLLCKG